MALNKLRKDREISTEENILVAAKKVFIEKGFYGTSTSDIAREAGVNKALLHYYYRSKERLFRQVFRQEIEDMADKIFLLLGGEIDLFEKIRLFIENLNAVYFSSPKLISFIVCEVNRNDSKVLDIIDSDLNKKIQTSLQYFDEQVSREVSEGSIKPIDSFTLFVDMFSLIQFPFSHKDILRSMHFGPEQIDIEVFLRQRSRHAADMIINSLKK